VKQRTAGADGFYLVGALTRFFSGDEGHSAPQTPLRVFGKAQMICCVKNAASLD
jgi:hypothetical protein